MITLHEDANQRNVFFHDMSEGEAIQSNQHMIIRNGEAIILDPGGHKVFTKLFAEAATEIGSADLKYMFCSHQDPDIVAAINGWLMTTDVMAFAPQIWLKFISHFGVDAMVVDRMIGIPDEGMSIELGGSELKFIPAHFLHSSGNYQLLDPASKILYSGDLGASVGGEMEVTDFEAHIQYMEGFHRRYMPSTRAMKMWANTARQLDLEIIAPQHGGIFRGKEMCNQFIDWIDSLETGADIMGNSFPIPRRELTSAGSDQ